MATPRIWVFPPATDADIHLALTHMAPWSTDDDVRHLWEVFYTPTAWLNPPQTVPFWQKSFGAFTLNTQSAKIMLALVQEGRGPQPAFFQKPHRLLPEIEHALTGKVSQVSTDLDAHLLDLADRIQAAKSRQHDT